MDGWEKFKILKKIKRYRIKNSGRFTQKKKKKKKPGLDFAQVIGKVPFSRHFIFSSYPFGQEPGN